MLADTTIHCGVTRFPPSQSLAQGLEKTQGCTKQLLRDRSDRTVFFRVLDRTEYPGHVGARQTLCASFPNRGACERSNPPSSCSLLQSCRTNYKSLHRRVSRNGTGLCNPQTNPLWCPDPVFQHFKDPYLWKVVHRPMCVTKESSHTPVLLSNSSTHAAPGFPATEVSSTEPSWPSKSGSKEGSQLLMTTLCAMTRK